MSTETTFCICCGAGMFAFGTYECLRERNFLAAFGSVLLAPVFMVLGIASAVASSRGYSRAERATPPNG